MLRYGLICDVDPSKGMARVNFQEDGITSHWLPMVLPFTKKNKYSMPFDINEHVACMMDAHCEYGVILGAIYSDTDMPQSEAGMGKININFADNMAIAYDRNTQTLSIQTDGDIIIKQAKNVTVNATQITIQSPETTIQGNVTISGNLAAAAITTTAGGSVTVDGNMTIKGDATIGGKSFTAHKHMVGSNTSTPPI